MTAQETTRLWPGGRRARPRQRCADGLPAMRLITRGHWRALAACQSVDPDLFFPVSASGKSLEQVTAAKAICSACPVRPECLAFALKTGQVHGVWGGLTEEERHQAAKPGGRGTYAGTGDARSNRTGEVRIA